jgi:pyrroline-5-carboxylate reductase
MISIVGAGVMGETFIAALLESGIPATDILISESRADRAREIAQKYAVASGSAEEVAARADIVIIAVKPQQMDEVLTALGPVTGPDATVISLAAGVSVAAMQQAFAPGVACIRAMPNTPALVGEGMTVFSCDAGIDADRVATVRELLGAVGQVAEVEESFQDAVTAISGSGPAYVFAMMEAMESAAIELGLDADVARSLVVQTFVGAASLARQTGEDPAELRRRVTSPGGTTAAALQVFVDRDLTDVVRTATRAARDRSIELGAQATSSNLPGDGTGQR